MTINHIDYGGRRLKLKAPLKVRFSRICPGFIAASLFGIRMCGKTKREALRYLKQHLSGIWWGIGFTTLKNRILDAVERVEEI